MSEPTPTSRLLEAVEILRQHNEWRRGDAISMRTPGEIGAAIDTVVQLAPGFAIVASNAMVLKKAGQLYADPFMCDPWQDEINALGEAVENLYANTFTSQAAMPDENEDH